MTPLEALYSLDHWIQVEFADQFKVIEKALKDYEQLKIVAKPLTDEEKKSINSVARRLKALEIIKKKKVNLLFLFQCFKIGGVNGYNSGYVYKKLTQEEFDLLKEVLK